MRAGLLHVRGETVEQITRGRLIKGAAALIGGGIVLSVPLVYNFSDTPVFSAIELLGEALACALVFVLAHLGYIRSSAWLLLAVMLIAFSLTTPAENIISGEIAIVLVLNVLVAGLVIGAAGALLIGLLSLGELVALSIITGIPWSVWTYSNALAIMLCVGLIWLIIRTQSRWADFASQQAAAARADQQELIEREQSLVAANQQLGASNMQMERLLSLVRDLETPTIPLLNGVLLVPLVGSLDERRADRVAKTVLQAIGDQRTQVVIIDITGVTMVDTTMVQYIEQLAGSAQLLGAQCILAGISAAFAQAIVDLGASFTGVRTVARLQDALAMVLAEMRIVAAKG